MADRRHLPCIVVIVVLCLARSAQAQEEQPPPPDRIFGVLPNFTTVEDSKTVPTITTKATFRMAAENSFDPYVFPFVGVIAAVAQAKNHEESWGQGGAGYGRRFAAALADNSIGSFLTTAIAPTLFRQDPRYFQLGEGSVWRRVGYAASRSAITRSRSGQRQFNYSEIGGNAAAAAISSAYYPSDSRSLSDTLARWGTQVMWDTLSNELKEFWPDIRRKMHKE